MAERVDDLILGGLKIYQNPEEFCFSLDAILLAHFPSLKKGMKVMDLGTGTGVIPLLLSAREGLLDKIIGLEIQKQMVRLARKSVALNKLEERIEIVEGDIKELKTLFKEKFDLILSNPPYMPLGTGKINPNNSVAIARHELLITLAQLIREASKVLKNSGKLALVHQADRLVDILYHMKENKLEPKRMRLIHPRAGSKANLVLVEAVLNAKPGIEVLEPLFVYKETGKYSKEILDIYGMKEE